MQLKDVVNLQQVKTAYAEAFDVLSDNIAYVNADFRCLVLFKDGS